jgi:2-aminoethylphosphonate-pyruvate transaminase
MEPLLLTPGPLTTAPAVRAAMLRDHGSRDPEFLALCARVRERLAALAPEPDAFEAVPLQGSGTFAVEAMLGTLVPPGGGAAVLVHGVYGERARQILARIGRHHRAFVAEEGEAPDLEALARGLAEDPRLTHVFTVHSETTTGQLLPLPSISEVVARAGRRLLVDAMSSLGAVPLDGVVADGIASSANKCLEGVPGLAFVLCRRAALAGAAGHSPSVSLDIHEQASRLARDGQFRFTPPTHVLAALDAALTLHQEEGGVAARGARYGENMRRLIAGMEHLGFTPLLPPERQGPIIATFHEPTSPGWHFPAFYEFLHARGFIIYPGSLARVRSFRVGCIGQVFPRDIDRFLGAVAEWEGVRA